MLFIRHIFFYFFISIYSFVVVYYDKEKDAKYKNNNKQKTACRNKKNFEKKMHFVFTPISNNFTWNIISIGQSQYTSAVVMLLKKA